MKKILLSIIAIVVLCGTSFGWDRRAHATTAKIAENHLTPKAKEMLTKYLHGKSIVYYASWADENKPDMLMELDFKPSNAAQKVTYPHTFEANADCSVFKGMRKDDKFVKNCVYMADQFAKDLKKNHSTMSDSLRFHKIAMLIHWLGDMHCPEHIRYPDDQSTGKYSIMWGNNKTTYHKIWDGVFFACFYPWGYSDAAYLIDTCTPEEIAKITKGDLYDWGKDAATASRATRKYREGAQINVRNYEIEFHDLLDSQIRNGGYRLAKLFNEIFK